MALVATPRLLGELVAESEGARLVAGDPAIRISGVTQDTRRLEPGDLFVALPGLERDGLDFVPEAIERGAAAIARRALADRSAAYFGHPSRDLPVIGVTGTDGKTSTDPGVDRRQHQDRW